MEVLNIDQVLSLDDDALASMSADVLRASRASLGIEYDAAGVDLEAKWSTWCGLLAKRRAAFPSKSVRRRKWKGEIAAAKRAHESAQRLRSKLADAVIRLDQSPQLEDPAERAARLEEDRQREIRRAQEDAQRERDLAEWQAEQELAAATRKSLIGFAAQARRMPGARVGSSTDRDGRISSYYITFDDDRGRPVRVSDHYLPDTDRREMMRELHGGASAFRAEIIVEGAVTATRMRRLLALARAGREFIDA